MKIWYFVITAQLKFESKNPFPHKLCDTYDCDYLPHTTFRFYLIDFQLNKDSPSQFGGFFTVKSPNVTQRSVSQENAFKKEQNPSLFFRKL